MLSWRRGLAALLVVLLVGIVPAAAATPIDPTWIAGCWDDGDFDSAVVFICGSAAVAVPSLVGAAPVWVPVQQIELAQPDAPPAPFRITALPRAPPVVVSLPR